MWISKAYREKDKAGEMEKAGGTARVRRRRWSHGLYGKGGEGRRRGLKREMQVVAMKVWELRLEPARMKDKDRG